MRQFLATMHDASSPSGAARACIVAPLAFTRAILITACLLALAFASAVRVRVWQSDLTLWADAAEKAPLKPRAVMNLGRAHELTGDLATAETAYRRVIWLAFDERRSVYTQRFSQAAAETNLAHLEMKRGHLAFALRILDGTLHQWPEFAYAHYNRGAILWMVGACDEARMEYRRAVSGDPQLPLPKEPCQDHGVTAS